MERKIRTLIVDDEPLARQRIRDLLKRQQAFEVVGEAANGMQAAQAIGKHCPDLLFLDVQMPDLDGLSLLKGVEPSKMPLTIFVTAYDQYALQAFDRNALDYLLKPFDDQRFEVALQRAKDSIEQSDSVMWRRQLVKFMADFSGPAAPPMAPAKEAAPGSLHRIAIKEPGRVHFVEVKDIDWIEAGGVYSQLHVGARCHLVRQSLSSLAAQLDRAQFIRIHRSALVRIARIREIQPLDHGDYLVFLRDGKRLRLSRTYAEEFKRALGL